VTVVSRVFRRAFGVWRNPVFLVPALIIPAASVLLSRLLSSLLAHAHSSALAPTGLADLLLAGAIRLAALWASLALLALAIGLIRNESATFANRLVPFGTFWRVVLVGGVSGLVCLIGLVFLIVPGLYAAVVWSQVAAVMVDGRADFFDSLEASQDLTRGSRGTVFVVQACAFLLLLVPVLVGFAFGLPMRMQDWSWTTTLAMTLVMTPLGAFNWAVGAALYLDLIASAAPLAQSDYFLAPSNAPS
jgi:uncharacterized membrane protein